MSISTFAPAAVYAPAALAGVALDAVFAFATGLCEVLAVKVRFMQLLRQVQGDPPHPNVAKLIDFLEPYRVAAQTAVAQGGV